MRSGAIVKVALQAMKANSAEGPLEARDRIGPSGRWLSEGCSILGDARWPARWPLMKEFRPERGLKARVWTSLNLSGAELGREVDVRGPGPILLLGPGPRTSTSRPTSAPDKRKIVQMGALGAHFQADFS